MPAVLNLAAYRFVPIDDPEVLARRLRGEAAAAGLKGTVLLAAEGINLFVAGDEASVRAWWTGLRADPRFAGMTAKESWSDTMPFARLKLRCKQEIIRMDRPSVRPADGRAASVAPRDLARWLDQGHDDDGRPLRLLDTRNAWEVARGRFAGALDWRLARFGDFPAALEQHRDAFAGHTVVSYCTGGIRCEKAALWMRERGVGRVLQLDGGILQYFADVPGARHWEGDCVVFDDRGALDRTLAPAGARPPPAALRRDHPAAGTKAGAMETAA